MLRAYQQEAIDQLRHLVRCGSKKILLVAPTGSGKTTIAAELISLSVGLGARCAFLAHRTELIQQASGRLDEWGVEHGIIQGDNPRYNIDAQVQVASVTTLLNRIKSDKSRVEANFDLIIIDEAHRSTANTYTEIVERHDDKTVVIGLTATPCRLNGKPLGLFYQAMHIVEQPAELIKQGYLVDPEIYAPSAQDLSGVKTVRGDYSQPEIETIFNRRKLVGELVSTWKKLADGLQTVVFCTGVEHSKAVANKFNKEGITAASIDGKTKKSERKKILEDFQKGQIRVLSNAQILTEGWDMPDLEVVCLARPTQSLALYLQMVGRVMRPSIKPRKIVLDHASNTLSHGLPSQDRCWDLNAETKPDLETGMSLKNCPKCFIILKSMARVCDNCEHSFVVKNRKGIEVVEGSLELIAEPVVGPRQEFLNKEYLKCYGKKKDGSNKSNYPARLKYKERYGWFPKKTERMTALHYAYRQVKIGEE